MSSELTTARGPPLSPCVSRGHVSGQSVTVSHGGYVSGGHPVPGCIGGPLGVIMSQNISVAACLATAHRMSSRVGFRESRVSTLGVSDASSIPAVSCVSNTSRLGTSSLLRVTRGHLGCPHRYAWATHTGTRGPPTCCRRLHSRSSRGQLPMGKYLNVHLPAGLKGPWIS